jgi:hypothetical protein
MRAHDAGKPEAIFQDRVMLVEIYKSIRDRPIYDAARYAWRANLRRAKKVDYVLAVYNGEIVEAFANGVAFCYTRQLPRFPRHPAGANRLPWGRGSRRNPDPISRQTCPR